MGKGGFARCYIFEQRDTGEIFAAKIIDKENLVKDSSQKKLMQEIQIHGQLHNENVVRFHHFFEDDNNVYILMDLCKNKSLSQVIRRRKRLHELEVRYFACQIIKGLMYIHTMNVIHRDIKLGNLFIDANMQIKLGDFGLAQQLSNKSQRRHSVCGTPNYLAPEVIHGQLFDGHSFEVDVWAFGIIIFILLFGKPPFEDEDVQVTYRKIREVKYSFPSEPQISEDAKNFIEIILVKSPYQRPSLESLLWHPFLNGKVEIPDRMSEKILHNLETDYLDTLMKNPNPNYGKTWDDI